MGELGKVLIDIVDVFETRKRYTRTDCADTSCYQKKFAQSLALFDGGNTVRHKGFAPKCKIDKAIAHSLRAIPCGKISPCSLSENSYRSSLIRLVF
jgi:hypothetical protein